MSVRVIARIRPLLKSELDKDTIVSADTGPEGRGPMLVRIPNPKNEGEGFSFQFNSVYGPDTNQQTLFEGEVAPTIKHIFQGFDVTLFAYGVTGTGKTHTMRGGKSLADRGVIPRLLSGIYRRARKIEKDSHGESKTEVSMSYYEIYNDRIYDLFEAPEKRNATGLPLRDAGGKTVVIGLTERPCENLRDFEKLYDQANMNRSTGATKLNAHSSRSHAILCVKVSQITGEATRISMASAIDLAGSEDNRRTDNNKERLVESSSINKSLFVLAQCVEAISKKASRIPYRESKMTRILSLGQNNGITIMILNLAPVRSYHLDTLSSLNFANRTKKIEVREVENEPIYKGCARQVAVGASLQRQPLRALTGASHNSNIRKPAESSTKLENKSKAFSVYSDKIRKSLTDNGPKKSSSPKRSSETFKDNNRPSKVARSAQSTFGRPQTLSKSTIENIFSDMVEKKVSEILAARALDQTVQAPPEISDEVKRRLELLERRIENQDDSRTEGLNYLLMAKQHHARGEDGSALKMYELAQSFFPDNAKLEAKIAKLRYKCEEKRAREIAEAQTLVSLTTAPVKSIHESRGSRGYDEDDDYQADEADDVKSEYYDSEPSFQYKSRAKKAPIKTIPILPQDGRPNTPRTKRLLAIVNSHDSNQIKLLRGVGAKRAEAIIQALREGRLGDIAFSEVSSLEQLSRFKGISAKAVINMRDGLTIGEGDDF